MFSNLSDEKLIELYNDGNPKGMEVLYERYVNKVYRLAMSKLGNVADAEDVTSQVFLKLCTALKSFRGESKFSTWIYVVTNNTITDLTRKKKPVISLDQDATLSNGDKVEREIEDPKPGPESIACDNDFNAYVLSLVSTLPEKQRSIIELRFMMGKSYQEIADHLKIELGTVKSRINRAIAALKDKCSVGKISL